MADSKNPLLSSAVFLTAATAFLYCVSTARSGGYLNSLRLDADVLDRNFHQVLYNGFLTSFGQLWIALFAYSACRLFYSHVFLPSMTDWLRKTRTNRRRFVKAKRACFGKRKPTVHERHQMRRTIVMLGYSAVGLALVLSLIYFEAQGKKDALVVIKQIDSGKPLEASSMVRVKIEDQVKSLFYLGCGARNCAGIDLVSKTVYYFPQNGHSFPYVAPTKPTPPSSAASRVS